MPKFDETLIFDNTKTPQEVANAILSESFNAGDKVAFAQDPISGFDGGFGSYVREANNGFAVVKLPNGVELKVLSNLLLRT